MGGMLFSASACGVMRQVETKPDADVAAGDRPAFQLAPAERTNSLTVRTEDETGQTTGQKKTIRLTVAGDVEPDEGIISDAAARAAEGKAYSFVKMFTGVYHHISSADLAFCSYSAAKTFCRGNGETGETPVELLATLSEMGVDAIDATKAGDCAALNGDYGIADVTDKVQILERDGVKIAFLSVKDEVSLSAVASADSMADLLILSVHWKEGASFTQKQETAKTLAQAGADVILGNGDTVEKLEWITDGGSRALAAYSLGNLFASGKDCATLSAGFLTFDVTVTEEGTVVENPLFTPTVTHYTDGGSYQIMMLETYADEIASQCAVKGLDTEALRATVKSVIPAEFLPADLRG